MSGFEAVTMACTMPKGALATSDSLCYSNRNQPQCHYFSLMDESAAQNIRMNLLFHFHSKSSFSSANLEA